MVTKQRRIPVLSISKNSIIILKFCGKFYFHRMTTTSNSVQDKIFITNENTSNNSVSRTDEVYRTYNLPERFLNPRVFKGYRQDEFSKPHPGYRSTSMDYGWYSPTVHTVPICFYPREGNFTTGLSRAGMYRNCSLNTELDKTSY